MPHNIIVDVISRPAYAVGYEQVDDITFVHVAVRQKWSPRVARQFRADIDAAHTLLGRPVYALEMPGVPLQSKFLAAHGFQPCGTVMDAQGRVVPIFGKTIDGIDLRRWQPN